MIQDIYTSGEYLQKNPLWHTDESPWKAKYILQMIEKSRLAPKTICDVGCGAGEVLRLVQEGIMDKECTFWGYEISPQAFDLSQAKQNERIHFKMADFLKEENVYFDIVLIMDVIEHIEDYFSFLRGIHNKSEYKIIQIPMDINSWDVMLGRLAEFREEFGHIHYFTKDLALQALNDLGYEVVDYFYTWQSNSFCFELKEIIKARRNLPRKLAGLFARTILSVPGRILFAIHKDLAVRTVGGWRLLVLAK
jgi:SAM-dependent methyltransferase